jgi:gas vesicle protein
MNDTTRTLLTLAAGAVAGAVTALLLAPQAGNETRRAIGKTYSRLSDAIGGTVQQGMDKINQLRGKGEEEAGSNGSSYAPEGTGRRQSATTGNTGSSFSRNSGTSGSGISGSTTGSTSGGVGGSSTGGLGTI